MPTPTEPTDSAGPTDSEDSAASTPTPPTAAVAIAEIGKELAKDASNFADKYVDLTPTEQGEVKQSMEWMGISIRRARKILRAYGGGKYLRRGIGAALALSFEFTSLEEAERALRWARKTYKDKNLPIRERVEAAKLIASLTESIRRICESSISMAEKFDASEKEPKPPAPSPVQVGVSINNYPPVAPVPQRANGGVLRDANGSESRDRAL